MQEDTLPIFYNEWGTTWGRPNAHLISESLPLLKQHSIDGYIIDAGWYKSKTSDWEQSHGDWQVDMMRFPAVLSQLWKRFISRVWRQDYGLKWKLSGV